MRLEFGREMKINGIPFIVHYEVDPGEPPSNDCPGCSSTVDVVAVMYDNRDFTEILSPDTLDAITLSLEETVEQDVYEYLDDIRSGSH